MLVVFGVCHWRLLVPAPAPPAGDVVSDPTSASIFTSFERLFELTVCVFSDR